MRRSKTNIREDATCHVCGGKVSIDFPVRSKSWAFGITGVRWMLCSVMCAEKLGTNAA